MQVRHIASESYWHPVDRGPFSGGALGGSGIPTDPSAGVQPSTGKVGGTGGKCAFRMLPFPIVQPSRSTGPYARPLLTSPGAGGVH